MISSLFLFTSFSKSFFIVLFAAYSVNANFRDYSYYVDCMNPLFPCDHGAATHLCIMHDTGRGTLCKMRTGAARGLERYKIMKICKRKKFVLNTFLNFKPVKRS